MRPSASVIVVCVAAVIELSTLTSAEQKNKPSEPVIVTNSNSQPVPVAGSISAKITNATVPVTGTVNANVTNMPNVNIANTPSVTVTSMPPVTLGSGATLNLDPATTVSTANIAARHVVRLTATVSLADKEYARWGDATLLSGTIPYVVPSGKRLVLDYIGIWAQVQTGQVPLVRVVPAFKGLTSFFVFPELHESYRTWYTGYTGSVATAVYVDSGSKISVWFERTGNTAEAGAMVQLQGYIVDCGEACLTDE